MMVYRRLLLPFLMAVIVVFSACRSSRKQAVDGTSPEQITMFGSIQGKTEIQKPPMDLSGQLFQVISEYEKEVACSLTVLYPSYRQAIDSASLLLASTLFLEKDPAKIVSTLNDYLFKTLRIVFTDDRNDVQALCPYTVLKNRRGSCVGMALLYLLLAEKLGFPVYGVLAPGHLFVRFDNGDTVINIETLRNGACMSREWYIEKYGIRDTNLYSMRNISFDETVGIVNYNFGTLFIHNKNYELAERYLERALTVLIDFPEAKGNLAIALDAKGASQRALDILIDIKRHHPLIENIDKNIASLQLKCKKYTDALQSYSELSVKHPEDPQFLYGKALAFYGLRKLDESETALTTALRYEPGMKSAAELLSLLQSRR